MSFSSDVYVVRVGTVVSETESYCCQFYNPNTNKTKDDLQHTTLGGKPIYNPRARA